MIPPSPAPPRLVPPSNPPDGILMTFKKDLRKISAIPSSSHHYLQYLHKMLVYYLALFLNAKSTCSADIDAFA